MGVDTAPLHRLTSVVDDDSLIGPIMDGIGPQFPLQAKSDGSYWVGVISSKPTRRS